jgi:transcriptional regulator with XRE-family HTH domain
MLNHSNNHADRLTGHQLRNAHLRQHSLARAQTAPPLARTIVTIRAETLGMTRLEFARKSGISRGTLRDLELGLHTPTRRVLQQFVAFCQRRAVPPEQLEGLVRLYAGPGDTLEQLIARLELRAGSPRELARRVSISPATLWEYRRGNFPVPLLLLRKLCQAVGEDSLVAEALWHRSESQRLRDRGYPEALAEFWVRCSRSGCAEKHLLTLGLTTATVRRMRYLELPAWEDVAKVAKTLCADTRDLKALQRLWLRDDQEQQERGQHGFGRLLKQLRKHQGMSRRELADLFGIGGKKPARIIKSIEEDGFYSAQAYPAGLAALLANGTSEPLRLLDLWQERRHQFHRRHRPEMRTDLRLARERYGFGLADMETILGYSRLEYQKIERGVSPLLDSARGRIVEAISQAGRRRVEGLLRLRQVRDAERAAWRVPGTIGELITRLARREGGLVPLARYLRQSGVKSLWPGRLKAIARGQEVPPWPVLADISATCGVTDLADVQRDWTERFRARLKTWCPSPLGIEVRLVIGSMAATLRMFSQRLGFNYSVLIRDLQRIDRDAPIKWYHVERILQAAELPSEDERWREFHALWYTAGDRRPRAPVTRPER